MILRENIGLDLVVLGTIISCTGVVANNILLDHILAMKIWQVSNIILFVWAYGFSAFTISYKGRMFFRKQQWWDGGLSGIVLCGMYAFFSITNAWGLMQV